MTRVKHLRKGDKVVALSGAFKGKTGKVLAVSHTKGAVQVEDIGIAKRHTKPSQKNPKGGIIEQNRWLPACKFMVCDASGKASGRTGWQGQGKDKKRVFSGARK